MKGTPGEVFRAFARLGVTSFGGPVAHLGYFRAEFVTRRGWLDERAFADLVGLCQFLPGPASSQAGFAIGLLRAGGWGGLAAWAGFTLPSALLLLAFAYGSPSLTATATGAGLLHGLKLVAVAIVAQAVWGMARSLCPDRPRAAIGTAALVLSLAAPNAAGQIGAIFLGALAGLAFSKTDADAVPPPVAMPVSRNAGLACLGAFAVLLLLALLPSTGILAFFDAFYRAGALVFGGGHVVLPLLQDAVVAPGWVSGEKFLAGYGATQAMPGPIFTFAAYLGAVASVPPGGIAGAVIALIAIFLPGLLLLTGVLPFWSGLRGHPAAQAAMRGVNAAVVGLLAAALYNPVWTGSVATRADFAVAAVGFVALTVFRAAPLAVVAGSAAAGALLAVAAS
jgi:chromate transporter